jgi:hypothetical protein
MQSRRRILDSQDIGMSRWPRWLAKAIKAGKKLEHFSIAQPAKHATKRGPKKARRAKKK